MWVKLDDRFWTHPKILETSLEGIGLFALGLSYAGAYETDGKLPHALISLIARNRLELVTELVKNGLWIATETGYEIHDFLAYNPSKASLTKDRKEAKRRMKRLRSGSGNVRANNARTPGRVGTSNSSLLLLQREQGKVRKGKREFPTDFTLTDKRREYAEQGGLEAGFEFGKFRDHHTAKGTHFQDWDAAWRTWCRMAWEFKQQRRR